MYSSQAGGTASHSHWERYHRRHHGAERHRWCTASRAFPRAQSLLLWLLVELLQRRQSRRIGNVLVWHSDLRRFRVSLPGVFDFACISPHEVPLTISSDVESHLAIYSSSSKPPSSQRKHHHHRYISTRPCSKVWAALTIFIGMLCYFLFWLFQFPFMLVSPQKIRWLFLAKAIIVPPTWLALLIWAFVKVPPNSGILAQKAELSGSALSWAWLSALNSALGLYSTLGVNIPDFTVSHSCQFYGVDSHHARPPGTLEIRKERKSVRESVPW